MVIWEYLKDGKDFGELIERVPDEFYTWLMREKQQLLDAFKEIDSEVKSTFKVLDTRKDTALYFQTQKHPTALFAMLDGKDYAPIIWKSLKPKWTQPFKADTDI